MSSEIYQRKKGYKRLPFSEKWRKNLSKGHIGQRAWNKGLTATTDQRVAKYVKNSGISRKGKSTWSKGLKAGVKGIRCGSQINTWRGGITPENIRMRSSVEFQLWREAIFVRDNYICQKCGDNRGGNLNSHHIRNFNNEIELRFAIDNGITFCNDCHIKFHKIYGYRNNTREQVDDFFTNS